MAECKALEIQEKVGIVTQPSNKKPWTQRMKKEIGKELVCRKPAELCPAIVASMEADTWTSCSFSFLLAWPVGWVAVPITSFTWGLSVYMSSQYTTQYTTQYTLSVLLSIQLSILLSIFSVYYSVYNSVYYSVYSQCTTQYTTQYTLSIVLSKLTEVSSDCASLVSSETTSPSSSASPETSCLLDKQQRPNKNT